MAIRLLLKALFPLRDVIYIGDTGNPSIIDKICKSVEISYLEM